MMYNSKSSRLRRMCGLALVPACAAALLVTNIPAVAALLSDTSSATMFAADEETLSQPVESVPSSAESTADIVIVGSQPMKTDEIVVVGYATVRKDSEKSECVQPSAETKGTISSVTPPAESSDIDEDKKVFNVVEEKPQFPGGEAALMQFIAQNIRYPYEAMKAGKQGRVIVQFVVTKTGSIGETNVIRGIDPDLDKEAIRVIKSLPAFTPGKVGGQPVNVWYTLPIQFKLTGNDGKKASSDSIRISSTPKAAPDGQRASSGPVPKVLVNGEEVPYESLSTINPASIEGIDVYKNDGDAGTISVTLKKGAEASKK